MACRRPSDRKRPARLAARPVRCGRAAAARSSAKARSRAGPRRSSGRCARPRRFEGTEADPRPGVASGHIPGARNLPFAELYNPDGTSSRPTKSGRLFVAAGADPDKPFVASCGSGVTANCLIFAARLLGNRDTRLYDGSWSEWGADPSTPKETGPGLARGSGRTGLASPERIASATRSTAAELGSCPALRTPTTASRPARGFADDPFGTAVEAAPRAVAGELDHFEFSPRSHEGPPPLGSSRRSARWRPAMREASSPPSIGRVANGFDGEDLEHAAQHRRGWSTKV